MDFGLSVLDVSPVSSGSSGAQALRNTLELARLAHRLGYERYWLAEHHNLPTIASLPSETIARHLEGFLARLTGWATCAAVSLSPRIDKGGLYSLQNW